MVSDTIENHGGRNVSAKIDAVPVPDVAADEIVDIVPEKIKGGWQYVDRPLAEMAKTLQEYRAIKAEVERSIRVMEARQRARIKKLQLGGPLGEWPTASQRNFITTFEMLMKIDVAGILPALENSYKMCIDAEVHRTNYLFGGNEPIMAAYARRMVEMTEGK